MYPKKGKWKVYNVSVGGVSLVTTYRNEFKNDVRTIGINGLINKIKKQNRKKS
ncbi:Toluene tolerance [Candidatus Thiomargarita nelsonii]|uniref:Toluene tolerance n=1 Tax=Candidatus Thiomargarita nelsonii TaxID=1003181 RepID=A0A176S433_9GAMM|nr:Toluene tolerance [Candidatus Thiomargarita nelsonii]